MRPKSEPYSRECAGWQFKARRLARDTRRRDARASRYTRASEKRDGGFTGRAACKGGRGIAIVGPQRRRTHAIGAGPVSRSALVRHVRLASRVFRAPCERISHQMAARSKREKARHKTCAVARAGTAKPGANAPPRQSEASAAEGGLRGGGGWVDVVKPNQVPNPPTTPHHMRGGAVVTRFRRPASPSANRQTFPGPAWPIPCGIPSRRGALRRVGAHGSSSGVFRRARCR